jgi:hypothetical protein
MYSFFFFLNNKDSKRKKNRISNWIYAYLCLNYQEATIELMYGPKRQVHIKFRDNGRMQYVL